MIELTNALGGMNGVYVNPDGRWGQAPCNIERILQHGEDIPDK